MNAHLDARSKAWTLFAAHAGQNSSRHCSNSSLVLHIHAALATSGLIHNRSALPESRCIFLLSARPKQRKGLRSEYEIHHFLRLKGKKTANCHFIRRETIHRRFRRRKLPVFNLLDVRRQRCISSVLIPMHRRSYSAFLRVQNFTAFYELFVFDRRRGSQENIYVFLLSLV